MESKLHVGNLSYNVTESQLRELFAQAGEVKDVVIVTDRYTQRPKGFGFVEFVDPAAAEKAIRMFNNYELDGRRLTVAEARPREARSRGEYGNRGDDRRGS